MPLTRLDNLISSKTGKYLYVSPDDFNATDALSNRGNSPVTPFKSIQRAFLEIARYSYLPGFGNDRFDQFTIMLMPGIHYIDNRPGLGDTSAIDVFGFDQGTQAWTDDSILDLSNPDNIFYKFNNTEGGAIIPRGSSLVGYDLRRTVVRPLFVPDPAVTEREIPRSAMFNVTGGCYFWQFTLKDGQTTSESPLWNAAKGTGEVYYDPTDFTKKAAPNYSHHKLTVFEYADNEELGIFYRKIAKAFSAFQPTIDDPGEFDQRVQENRIVGPLSDSRVIESLKFTDATTDPSIPASTTEIEVTTKVDHGYFQGQFVAIANTEIDDVLEGIFQIKEIDQNDARKFKYEVPFVTTGIGSNIVSGQTISVDTTPALGQNAQTLAEVDSVESASPYVFNCSIRSTWGICGIWANGLKATGFKSVVIAQYTGVSLQKDDRSFIRYDEYTNTWNQASLTDAFATVPYHTKGDAYWKDEWRNFHVRASEDAFIQCVSIFAVGFADHFLMESGGDMSITNSNSNFGNTSLHAKGHKGYSFAQDKGGYIDSIIPPEKLIDSTANQDRVDYYTWDVQASRDTNTRLYYGGSDNVTDPKKRPAATLNGYRIGAKSNEKIYVELDPYSAASGKSPVPGGIYNATLSPSGYNFYPSSLQILNPTTVVVDNKSQDAANRIEDNKELIQEETYGFITKKYPDLLSKNIIISKCQRDVGLVLDAVISDLRLGGNINTIQAAESYFSAGELNYIDNEKFETIEGFEYARDLAIASIRNWTYLQTGCSISNNSSLVTVPSTVGLVIGMKVQEYTGVNSNNTTVDPNTLTTANIPTDTYIKSIVNPTTIELGSVVAGQRSTPFTGAAKNATGSNSSANLWFSLEDQNGVRKGVYSSIEGDVDTNLTQDTVYPQCNDTAQAIATLMNNIKTIINQGINPVGDRFADAHDLLLANKEYIADVAVKDMNIEYPQHTVPGGNVNCYDDVVDVIEAVAYNIKFGSNNKVWDAANLYVVGADLAGEEEQSIYTFRKAKEIANSIIQNVTYTPRAGVVTSFSQTKDLTITTDPGPVNAVYCADVISAMATLFQLIEYGIDTAGISSQALGTFTPTDAVYDGATGDLTLTMAGHGLSAQNKIGINQNGLTFSCGMDNHGSNHAYPRVGDPAYKNAIRDITNITADTVTINVGTTPLVGHNVSDATYDPATGNLVLSLGAHNISQGNTLQLEKDALVFTCTQDNNQTEHSYPRTSDPVYNNKVEVTAVEETDHTPTDAAYNPVNGELVLTVAGHPFKARSTHTPTDAAFNPATGILTLTVANHQFAAGTSVILANNSITFTCAKDSHATNHSYPRATDPAAGKRLPIQNITGNTFDVQIGISSDVSEHRFVSAGNNSVTRVGSMVKLVNDSLTFTCAKDNNASNHTYPRATDEASTEWLEITTATTDTFLINVSPSPDTSIHNFVSATAGAVKRQTGKITVAVGVTPEVTFTPTAATYEPTTGEMTLTIGSHTLSGPSTHTATDASYNPVTGILTTTVANHGFSLGDRVRIADDSLVMTCGMDGDTAQKSYPRATDPYSKKWMDVVGVTDSTFDVNVGTSPLVGFIPTAVDYNPTTGDMEMTIGSHSLTVGTSIKLAPNSLTFTCAQDGGGSEHSYPRSSDPASDTAVNITAVTATTITVNVLTTIPSTNTTTHTFVPNTGYTPTAAGYDPNTGVITFTLANHGFAAGDFIKIADNSLTFTCMEDNNNTNHVYPRPSDPISGKWVKIDTVTQNGFTINVLTSIPSTNATAHTFVSATANCITRAAVETGGDYPHTFVSAVADGITLAGESVKIADNSLTFTCGEDSHGSNHTYPRTTDPASDTSLPILATTGSTITVDVGTSSNTTAHTFVSALGSSVASGGNYAHTFVRGKQFGVQVGGAYAHTFVSATTDGVTAYSNNAGQFAATTKSSPSQNSIQRVNPSESSDQFAQRATLFTVDAGGTNPHKFETGTPVRLVARAKAGKTPDERDVRLPLGFQPNRKYYVIAPGRNTQPFNYNDAAVYSGIFDGGDQTKLMLAESAEAAAAGIYIYSPETESLDEDVEILIEQYVLDSTYDLHEYRVTFDGSSGTIFKTEVAHIFDKPTNGIPSTELQKVFFRKEGSDGGAAPTLPTLSGGGGALVSSTQEYYVRYETEDTFKIFATAADAIAGAPEVVLVNNPDQFWYVFANKRTSPMRFDPTFVDTAASRVPPIPDGLWYLNLKDETSLDDNIITRIQESDYDPSSGQTQTTDSYYTRLKDDRVANDRIYRLRYVQPKEYPGSVRQPNNGFVMKIRTDTKRNLIPQNIVLEKVGGSPDIADFRNPQSANSTETLGMTKTEFDAAVQAGTLTAKNIYDPDNHPRIVNTDNYIRFSIRSARKIGTAGSEKLELTVFDHTVDDTNAPNLKNTVFHTVEIDAPQAGSFATSKTTSSPTNLVEWTGGSSGFGYIHAYFSVVVGADTKHYIILKDVSARPTYNPLVTTKFEQGAVYAQQQADVNGGRDSKDNNLYVVGDSNVFTVTPGDTLNDTVGNTYKIVSVEDVKDIDDTFYIFDSDIIQERVAGQQDGIYYLTAVRGNISPLPRGAGVGQNFQNFKFSQPISSLYPLDYKNDPLWYQVIDNNGTKNTQITDPPAANSFADNYTHGLVWVNDYKRSMTKEAVEDLTQSGYFSGYTYNNSGNKLQAVTGNATAGSEQRQIPIAGDTESVHDQKVYIELRRPSIARSGNHTFEYLGFGPGNYSSGLPARQEVILSEFQDYYSQAKREDGGIVFYTGLNSNGDLYIGNKKIDAITGEETFLEKAQLVSSEDDTDTIGQLITSFDTPVTFKDKITVEGISNLNNQVIISTQPPTEVPSLIVRSNPRTDGLDEDNTLSRTSFADNNDGDITISQNKISSAILHVKGRGTQSNPGQAYSIRSNFNRLDALPSNRTPDQAGTYNSNQVVSYYSGSATDANPQAGDILYKGGSIENSGSLGWIFANYYTNIPATSILDVTTNGGTTVKIKWSGVLTNTSGGINLKVGSTIRITGFVDQTAINGKWIVSKADPSGADDDFIEFICANALPAATYTWDAANQPNALLERSDENWKETGVIGAEALRTDTDSIGQYKLGVNTIARTAHDSHQHGFLTYTSGGVVFDQQKPRANLDVVGNAFISGKDIDSYSTNTTISKVETLLANAFLVGGDSSAPQTAATLRVSTLDGRVGINATNAEMDASLFVKGTLHLFGTTANADIDGDLNVDGGDVTTNTASLNLFNDNATTVNFVGDVTTLKIGDDATAAQTIDIGTSSTDTTLNVHTSSIDSTVNIGVVADGATNKSVLTFGGAFSNTANSTFTIKNAQTILDGDLDVNGGDLQSNSQTINLFTRAGAGSEVNFASRASVLNFGGVAGSTTIRNSLKVNGDADIYGDTTMHGGSNSGTVTVQRAKLGTSKVAHATGSLTDLNVDFYKFVDDIDGSETVSSVNNSDGTLTLVQNYFIDGNQVKFTDVSGLTGVNTNDIYYIINQSGNNVQVSTTASTTDKVSVTGTPGVAVALTLDKTKIDTSGAVGGSTTTWTNNSGDVDYEYLPLNNVEGINIGDIIIIGTELVEVVSPGADKNNRRVKVSRGTDCTTVAIHNDNTVIRKLEKSPSATFLLGRVPQNSTTPTISAINPVSNSLEVPIGELASGDAVKFTNTGSIVGVNTTATYFVVQAVNDTGNSITRFELSLDPGGSTVPISGTVGSAVLNFSDTLLSLAEFGGQFNQNDYLRLNPSSSCPSGEFVQIVSVNNTNSEKFIVNDGTNALRFVIDSVYGGVTSNVLGDQDFTMNLYGNADTNSTDNQFRIVNGETLPATRLTVDSDGKLTIVGVGTEAAPKAIINKNGEEWLSGNLRLNNNSEAGSVDSAENSFYVNSATGNTLVGGLLSINDDFKVYSGATGVQFGGASTATFEVDAQTGDTRIGTSGSALGDGDLTVNGGHVNIVSTSTATPAVTDYALNITNLGVNANRNYRIRQDAAIDAFGVTKFYNKNGGRHWTYVTSTATLESGKNYMITIAADTVFTLPADAETGDMIRFIEVGGNLSYDASLIIRAPLGVRMQGDAQGTNAGGLSSSYQGGELIVQTRNAGFGLVYAGSEDSEANTIPSTYQGWWLAEI